MIYPIGNELTDYLCTFNEDIKTPKAIKPKRCLRGNIFASWNTKVDEIKCSQNVGSTKVNKNYHPDIYSDRLKMC